MTTSTIFCPIFTSTNIKTWLSAIERISTVQNMSYTVDGATELLKSTSIKDIKHQIDLAKELNEYADVTDYYKEK